MIQIDAEDFRSARELIGKWSMTELAHAEAQIRALEEHPGWRTLTRLLAIDREQKLRDLTMRLHDHAEYARQAGVIHGTMLPHAMLVLVKNTAAEVRSRGGFEDAENGE